MKSMVRRASTAIALVAALTTPVHASLSDALEDMLDVGIQVNNPGPVSTLTRGGFYGGSIYIRGQVVDMNVINFTPPSFASGCGGIDLFGGSFSFINAAQFIALLRAIAQNASAYAFHLALKNLCEQCSTILSGLQKVVQSANEFTGNSCQLAQGIVNDSIKALTDHDVKSMSSASVKEGFAESWDAFWGGLDQVVNALNTTVGGSNTYEDRYELNVVWKAISSGVNDQLALPNSHRIRTAMMSITGTVILTGPVDDENGEPSSNVQRIAGNRISFRDLVYGNERANILRCDEFIKCLNVGTEPQEVTGTLEHLEREFIGTGPNDTTSTLFQLVNGSVAQKENAQAKVTNQLGTIGNLLIALAETAPSGSTSVWFLFDRYKEYIAVELAAMFISQTIALTVQEISQERYDTAFAEDWINNDLKEARERIDREIIGMMEEVDQPPATEFIEMFRHQVSINPFTD